MPRSANYWDCVALEELGRSRSHRLFGNANIGNFNLTNLQVAGQLGYGDEPLIVTNWYARTDFSDPDYRVIFDRFTKNAVVVFQIGDRIIWQARLDDLLHNHRDPITVQRWPEVIPKRQHVACRLDSFPAGGRFSDLDMLSQAESTQRCRLWVHIEGLRLLNNESDGVDNADDIIALLTHEKTKLQVTAEERIVTWLTGILKDEQDPAGAAQLHAVVDGILEGRHR